MTVGLAFGPLFRLKRRKFAQGAKPAKGSIKISLLVEQSLPKPSTHYQWSASRPDMGRQRFAH
jgi:hypothetical protein